LEEVSHLDVNTSRSCRYFNFDIRNISIVTVGCKYMGVDQFGYFAKVAVCEDAAVDLPERLLELVYAFDVLVANFLI